METWGGKVRALACRRKNRSVAIVRIVMTAGIQNQSVDDPIDRVGKFAIIDAYFIWTIFKESNARQQI